MTSFRCANCSLLNFDTASACKRCGLPFGTEAEQPPGAPPEYGPPPPPDPPAEVNSYFWDQPNYQPHYIPPRPPPVSSGGGKKIVGVAVLLAVLSLIAFVAIPRLLKPRKANFTNLSWTEYQSPDGGFSVSLPATPKETNTSQPTGVGSVRLHAVVAEVEKDFGCMVMYAEYPAASKVSEELLYEQMLKNFASANAESLSPGNRKFINHDGHRGIEIEFKPPVMQKLEAKARARLFWIAPRLYMVMSGGPETPEFAAVSDRCLDSFKFSSGR